VRLFDVGCSQWLDWHYRAIESMTSRIKGFPSSNSSRPLRISLGGFLYALSRGRYWRFRLIGCKLSLGQVSRTITLRRSHPKTGGVLVRGYRRGVIGPSLRVGSKIHRCLSHNCK
jgi:hypothetical protein